jgi:hypothetical protein
MMQNPLKLAFSSDNRHLQASFDVPFVGLTLGITMTNNTLLPHQPSISMLLGEQKNVSLK